MDNRFTQIPDIYPTGDNATQTNLSWAYIDGAPGISVETVVLSWAALLHAYTGDELPVFALNQRAVKVILAEESFDPISLPEMGETPYTAVNTIRLEGEDGILQSDAGRVTGKCSLSFDIDMAAGCGVLRSEVGILQIHLEQIGLQLSRFMRRFAQSIIPSNTTSLDQDLRLSIANHHPHVLPGPQFLHQLAFSHGLRDLPALDFLDHDESVQSLSFHELDCLSTQMAKRITHTLGPPRPKLTGRIIPVLLAQSVELYIAWLAILKAGAAFCPLSTDAPEDRIRFILKDVSADMVVTHSTFKKKIASATNVSLLFMDSPELEPSPNIWQEPVLFPEDLAYVMYTSGSTGRPKGVAISHRAATQSLLAHDGLIPSFRRFIQFASPTFDVSVFEVFFPWFRGATLVGSERSNMLLELPKIISEMQVDAAELTPTVAGELLRSRKSVPSLKVLLTIGEMLTKRVVEEFGSSQTQDGILHGMYGPTEAAIHCTAAPGFHSDSRVNLIGQPLNTVSAFVVSLDDSQSLFEPAILPIGQIGELVVGGSQLADGYINRPIENSKAFICSKKYGRLYRTGDKARFLPNGDIECFGRVSTGQIKLRGQRVELGEIESVVSMAPGIRSTVVGAVSGILIAWLLAEVEDAIHPSEIRNFCQGKLPGYMVPGDFVIVNEFPQLESGKINRKALEAEYTRNQKETFVERNWSFRDPLEEKIAEVVNKVVDTSTDSLSAAGLDSLKGIKLAAKLRDIGINLDVSELLAADSVSGIWDLARGTRKISDIAPQMSRNTSTSVVTAGYEELSSENLQSQIERIELCSDTQLAMLSESLRDGKAYCNWIELKFSKSLDLARINQAFCKLIENNEMLRSAFLLLDLPGHPFCQVIWNNFNMTTYFQETTAFNYDWRMDTSSNILTPFKVQFIQDESSVRSLLQLHHAIYDGWSWELLLNDLQFALAKEPLVPRPSYSAIVKHYMTLATSDSAVKSKSYWANYLQGAVALKFPNFHGRHGLTKRSSRFNLDLNVSLPELGAQAQSLSIGRQVFFQASLAYVLSFYLDSQDVILGTVFSGRTAPVDGIEAIIGPCLRILPNRVNLSWVRTISDLLTVIQRDNRKALQYGDLSLREIKKISGVEKSNNLFESLLVWQETSLESLESYTSFEQVASADYLEFPLTIELEPNDGKITATATFDESTFPAAQVHLLLKQIDAIAEIFIRSPEALLSSVNEQLPSSVLSIENDHFTHFNNLAHLAYQVEQIAANEPMRNAIEFIHSLDPDTGTIHLETLTYYDLNSRSNRLAQHLLSSGVSSGDLVAVILDKSIELYVSILAIVKIAAGYVPLTLSTPIERIRVVLNETKPKLGIIDSSVLADLGSLVWFQTLELETCTFMEQYPDENVTVVHQVSNTAYVVFTSGSTGEPKGVAITHHNLQSNIATLTEIYPTGPSAKILQACSQAFDVAGLIRPENVPEVRVLVTAGEGLTAKVHQDWAGKGLYQVNPNVSMFDDLRNIGKPLKNTSAFVISGGSDFTLLPRGAVGEFCFGGDQVGEQYLKQPDLTKERFLDHPNFGRVYRSGDFGRLLSDGSLMFTGRRDDQVKLRGQRIELGEISNVILHNEKTRDCTSMIVSNKDKGQEQLISFFIPERSRFTEHEFDDELTVLINRLYEDLSAKLPPYMIPSSLIPIALIPMTAVKKIDTKKLTEKFHLLTPDDLHRYSRSRPISVTDNLTSAEEGIARIISQATQTPLEHLRVNTSLYSIGLDSLSAIYVSKRLRESGFGQIDISLILRNSSIGELAKAIERAKDERDGSIGLPALRKSGFFEDDIVQKIIVDFEKIANLKVESVIPCTALQEAMLSRTASHDKHVYWNHILLEFYGDAGRLRDVLQQMVCRHGILRTCFVGTSDARYSFAQVILESISLPFISVETTDMNVELRNQKSALAQHIHEPYRVPYSISVVTDTCTKQKFLLVSIHHAIHDGEAMSLLFKEIEDAYEGSSLPPAIQFHQFVDYMLAENHTEHGSFWVEYLRDISVSHICSQRAAPEEGPQFEIFQQDLGITLTNFETACKNLSVTPLTVLHASWARLLSLYTNSSDICFGTVVSGRTALLDGVEDIIGPCFNVLPIRVQISPNALNIDVVRTAQKANADILAHQHTSLRDIQKKFSRQGRPLFDSIVLFQRPARDMKPELWRLVSEEGEMDFPIILEVIPSTRLNNISIHLHTDASQVPSADARMIVDDFIDLVFHTIKYPLTRGLDKLFSQGGKLPSVVRIAKELRIMDSTTENVTSPSHVMAGILELSGEETLVRDVMSVLSKYEQGTIKRETTIFQLGLDSINAVQISRILKDKGYAVSAADILEKPSMSQIAELLHKPTSGMPLQSFDFQSFELEYKHQILKKLAIEGSCIESIRPCSSMQSGMLAKFTESKGELYLNRLVLKMKENLDILRLKDAWSRVMARHEMLRTGFIHLKDPKSPFAMITYTEKYATLPWIERNQTPSEEEYQHQARLIFKNMHLPPWKLALQHSQFQMQVELTAMHAIYDAQSLDLVLCEVAEVYKGSEPLSLPVPITPILGHILNAASSQTDSGADAFWSTMESQFQATKFPNLTPFNIRNSNMVVKSQYASKSLNTIKQRCKSLGVSLQAAGQAAYARLLSNYLGETNVSFGVVFSGRDIDRHAENAVFPCLVTVPIQCHVQRSNKELVSSIMRTNALLLKNQFTPLSRIQRLLKHEGPLIDTLFVYQKLSRKETESQLWEVADEYAKIDYPLSVEMVLEGDSLALRLTCRSDIIPQEQAGLMLRQLDSLLVGCLFMEDSDSMDISALHPDLLSVTPAKEKYIPSPISLLHEYVEKTARELPDKTALEFVSSVLPEEMRKESWTYRELDQMGNKVARLLQSLKTETSGLVAICFDKCPSAYFAILGVLKSGHAYVALDPTAPFARKQFIIEDSGARVVLCASDRHEELQSLTGAEVIALDQQLNSLNEMSSDPLDLSTNIDPQDTCYCLYTSGTTGTPKGCEITHENAVQAMEAFTRLFSPHWNQESRWLQFASFHFDVSVLEQYWSWSVGICVTSCPRDVLFQDLPGTINRLEITHIDLTPSLAKLVTPEEVPSLCKGVFITGGEALKQEILEAWGKHKVIYNGYGPTEVTIGCTMLPRMDENSKSSNIGPQFDNVGSYVFQPGTNIPVLRGCIGELCVSGALVGRGYLNRPELTQERFQYLDNFRKKERFYRTGDLVRILHDGSFQFNGRIDDQVKLRGQRLELGEINAVIQEATSDVSEVATLVIKHPSQQKEQLVVFVSYKKQATDKAKTANSPEVLNDDHGKTSDFLACIKQAAQNKLPGYMMPTHFIPIKSLPLTPNNKIDVKALKTFFSALSLERLQALSSSANETRSLIEKDIQAVIRVLAQFAKISLDAIFPNTSIYDIGLDSISVIGLAQHFRDAGYQNAQVSMIMRNPTVADIATSLKSNALSIKSTDLQSADIKQKLKAFVHENSVNGAEKIGISLQSIEDMAPCTPLQEGMIARFLESFRGLYCSSFRFELKPETDLGRLKNAWAETQIGVQLLRVRMTPLVNGYAQIVLKHDELPWIEMDAENERDIPFVFDNNWNAWRTELRDFSCALWRLVVVKSPNRRFLCLNIFHALYDGNSLPILLEQVALRYHGKPIWENIPKFMDILPYGPLRISPGAREFWMEHLVNTPGGRLFNAPKTAAPESISLTRVLDQVPDYEHIKATLQVTENSIFHACWLLTLQEHFSLVPPLGIVVSGRALDIPGIESVTGPLFNTIPSYIPLHNLKTKADLIRSCHLFHVSALPFQQTPLRDIMKWTRRRPRNPLFETLFVFQKELKKASPSPATNIWTVIESADAPADFPLSFEVRQSANTVILTLTSQDFAVPADTAKALLSTFERISKDIQFNHVSALPDVDESSSQSISNPNILPQSNGTEVENTVDESDWSSVMIEVRNVVADLAGVDISTVHPGTSIFELGLDSIDAIRLSSRLKHRGIDLPVSSIMKHQTILNMSERLSVSTTSSNGISHVSLAQLEDEIRASLGQAGKLRSDAIKVLPLTALQESMVAEMLISKYQHYYGVEVFEVMQDTDIPRLLESWDAVINANPILRTSFVEIEDPKLSMSFAQVVHPPKHRHVQEIDIQQSSINDFIQSKIFDDVCPAFYVNGIRKAYKYYLILSMAHALYDGWSLDLLHADVEEAYRGNTVARPSYEPVLEQILNEAGESHRQFWTAALKDFKPRTFPIGQHPGGNRSEVHRTELLFDIPSETIKHFCRQYGITVQALSVATWTLTLASFVESLDVGFGLVLSGRSHADADKVMFPTMNTVVFRSILHGSRLEMLKYVQNSLNSLIEHHHYPLRKAGSEVAAGNLFDTLFIYQKRPTFSSSRSPIYKSISGKSDTGYPLSVEMELLEESIICRLAARDDRFGMKDATNILDRVAQVFRLVISKPQHPTIEFADTGIRICGSPFFHENRIELQPDPNGGEVPTSEVSTSWTTLESKIREVLSVISGTAQEDIKKDSTLFHLGLDSISAIKVCSLLRKQAIVLPVSSMLKAGSIHKMAAVAELGQEHIEQHISSDDDAYILKKVLGALDMRNLLSLNGISMQEVDTILPVTAGQIYCLVRNAQDPQLFHASFYYKVAGLDKIQLSEGWKLLMRRLPILRTAFIRTGHRETPWVQVIMKNLDNSICWHATTEDVEFLSPVPRSVAAGPVSLHAVETGQGLVINLHIHHALYDAISLPRIIDCLGQICTDVNTQLDGNMDFAKFIIYQNVHSLYTHRHQFWKTYLAGVRPRILPVLETNHDYSGQESRHGLYQPGLFEDIESIEAVARQHGLSSQSLFMAIYAKIHSELLTESLANGESKGGNHHPVEDDFVVGVYLANRGYDLEGLQDMISPTLNMVPLRIAALPSSSSCSSSPLIESAHQIQRDLHEISRVDHSGVSLLEIKNWTGIRVDIFVNFLKLPDPGLEEEELKETVTGHGISFVPLQAEKLGKVTHGASLAKSHAHGRDGLGSPRSKEEEEKWKEIYMVR
ncbi:hypothetical protein UA08_04403 [Talaromyces atroroseus]|uniref:Nonribosomal peptide synthetase sidC n=1 Tax=Talaromyces atroroseus TaxID=1441469 RepID=A0A1Q5Q8U6_TALAT|nr:hypothetical protein UA08_04403 [Talaromyces atroroseus]OKL60449.1 hypothetical protein UA08_04403 [Talaromyces atroroseus]